MYPTAESLARKGHNVLVSPLRGRDDLVGWVEVGVWRSGTHPWIDDKPEYEAIGATADLALLDAVNAHNFDFCLTSNDVAPAFYLYTLTFSKADKTYSIARRVDDATVRSYGTRVDFERMVSAAVKQIVGFGRDAQLSVLVEGWVRSTQRMLDAGFAVTIDPVKGFEGFVRATAFRRSTETEVRTVPMPFTQALYELEGHVFGKYYGLKHGEPNADRVELANLID